MKPGSMRISLAHSHPVPHWNTKIPSVGDAMVKMDLPKAGEVKRVMVLQGQHGQMGLMHTSRLPNADLSHISAPEGSKVTHSLEITGAGPNSPPRLVKWLAHEPGANELLKTLDSTSASSSDRLDLKSKNGYVNVEHHPTRAKDKW